MKYTLMLALLSALFLSGCVQYIEVDVDGSWKQYNSFMKNINVRGVELGDITIKRATSESVDVTAITPGVGIKTGGGR